MNITDIRIRQIPKGGRMKAIASVTFDGNFVVHDMKVIEGANGIFLAMPSRRLPGGSYRDIAHPINTETRELLEEKVLAEYEKLLETQGPISVKIDPEEPSAPKKDEHFFEGKEDLD